MCDSGTSRVRGGGVGVGVESWTILVAVVFGVELIEVEAELESIEGVESPAVRTVHCLIVLDGILTII